MMEQAEYSQVRMLMKPGDIIAFGGRGLFSGIIKAWTRSPVSHVGIVRDTGTRIQVAESTSMDGFSGVVYTRLSDRVKAYRGRMWWLSLSQDRRKLMDLDQFWGWINDQHGKEYDLLGALRSSIWPSKENYAKQFCSEVASGALEAGGVIKQINASAVTPQDLCAMKLYAPTVYQIKGRKRDIPRRDTINPEGFDG